MSSFRGALKQYFTVDEKPRLHKRDTWFEDHGLTSRSADIFWIGFTLVALALAIFCTVGVIL